MSLYVGDCRDGLRSFIAAGVRAQMCVTSPPYWGLRDYGTAQWAGGDEGCDHVGGESRTVSGGAGKQYTNAGSNRVYSGDCDCGARRIDRQLGLEPTIAEYVANMVEVFRLVREVLADDGVLFLNLGDSYAGSWGAQSRGDDVAGISAGQIAAHPRQQQTGTIRDAGLKPKDLCGIPWRVAFALQQPHYTGNIKSELDRAWLAALVDGEGCITILEAKSPHGSGSSYPPVLQIRMCDTECIAKAVQITGYGDVSPPQEPPSQPGQRPSYQWRLHGRKAANTIAEIYPYLLIKRKQAIVAWNQQMVRDGYETKRGVKIPADDLSKQIVCRELAQKLNRREQVEIPSWMVEPAQPIEPGWYLRQDLIWAKPNPMPESVTDRCTKAHEYLFLLAKSERYFYDAAAIAEPAAYECIAQGKMGAVGVTGRNDSPVTPIGHSRPAIEGMTRNRRSVWTVTTQPYAEAHFATFPTALVEPCIMAGSRVGDVVLDPFMGSGTVAQVAQDLGRRWIGCELNPEYAKLIERRTAQQGMVYA